MKKKIMAVALATIIAVMAVAGASLAWLKDTTDSITNTFTEGKVDIELTETARTYKMIPGNTLPKDPTVVVKAGSEACYVFVQIAKNNNPDGFLEYTIDSKWTQLGSDATVYYIKIDSLTVTDKQYNILTGNQVKVKEGLEMSDMKPLALDNTKRPSLSFTAYAIQADNFATEEAAWTAVHPAP